MGRKRYNTSTAGAVVLNQYKKYYMYRFWSIAMSCFKWTGLPDSIDERFLEETLLRNGSALYFNDEVMGNLALQVILGGQFDVYNNPVQREAYSNTGYHENRTKDNSVIIYDNSTRMVIWPLLEMFAERLAHIDQTIDINMNAQKTPVLILCDEKQRVTMENLFLKYDSGTPVIFGSKNLDLENVKVLNLESPYVVDKLHDEKMNIMREAFSFLGVGNLEIEKRERLITHEVQTANEPNIAQRLCRLNAREKAAEEINQMFGTHISVEYNPAVKQTALEWFLEDHSGLSGRSEISKNLEDNELPEPEGGGAE